MAAEASFVSTALPISQTVDKLLRELSAAAER
jgi:hypothetical protein